LQLAGSIFLPKQVCTFTTVASCTSSTAAAGSASVFITPGFDGTGTIGRNTFFTDGIANFDAAFVKNTRIREGMSLQIRMEFYNLFNHVTFGTPARTVLSTTPLGRITATRALANYVNSGAVAGGARQGQFALRFMF